MFRISKKSFLILNYIPLAALSSSIITPALPEVRSYYQLSLGLLEWVVSIFLIGYMCGQFIYGPYANLVGRIFSLRAGLVLGLVGIAICFISYYLPYFWILLLGRFINALGSSSGLVCAFILMNEELEEQEAKTAFAYCPMSFSLSVTSAIFIGGVMAHWWGWQYTFILVFVHNAIMLYLTRYIPSSYSREAYQKMVKPSSHIKVDSKNVIKLLCLSFIVGTTTCFTYIYTTAAPLIGQSHFNFNPSQYGIWNLINVFGVLFGTLTLKLYIKKIGGKRAIFTSLMAFALASLSFLLILLTDSSIPLWFFFTSSLMYFSSTWGFATASYYASNAISNKALGSSILTFINLFCAVMGVIILGYLSFDELLNFIIVGASFLACAMFCYLWIAKNKVLGFVPIQKP